MDIAQKRGKPLRSLRAMQDAVAGDRINYILVIPNGFGEQMQQSFAPRIVASESNDPVDVPQVETAVSFSSAKGTFMDARINAFLDQVSDHLRVGDSPASCRQSEGSPQAYR